MIRLNKALAKSGICSRREADYYIKNGMVLVNKAIVNEPGIKINENEDKFELSTKAEKHLQRKVSIIYHKPLGIVSSQPEEAYIPAIAKLTRENYWDRDNNDKKRTFHGKEPRNLAKLAVCGRLDINSTGLLFFTQEGVLAKKILSKSPTPVEKEYLVRVDKFLQPPRRDEDDYYNSNHNDTYNNQNAIKTQRIIDKFLSGFYCTGDLLKASDVQVINENQLKIVLTDGKHHQIRRMCSNVGLQIKAIKRVRIGQLPLRNLPVGRWRYFLPGVDRI